MKLLKNLFPVLLIALMWASCSEDDGPGTGAVLPVSDIDRTSVVITSNGSFSVVVDATAGDSPLNTLTIRRDGNLVDDADIMINGSSTLNPLTLTGALKDGFSFNIDIQTDLGAGESAVYSFIIDADNNDNTTESVTVSVEDPMVPPFLDLTGDPVAPNDVWQIPLVASMGTDTLETIAVYENGVLVETSRGITLGTMTFWSNNPNTLTSPLDTGFTEELIFDLPDTSGNYSYLVIITDKGGLSDSVAFSADLDLGTPIETIVSDTLWNFAGPNAGSMQIPGFNAVFVSEPNYDFRDEGNAAGEWESKFSLNSSSADLELRNASSADWNSINNYEDIEAAWNAATLTTGTTDAISEGDIYIISKGGILYAMRALDVVNTSGDDEDYYTFLVKKQP